MRYWLHNVRYGIPNLFRNIWVQRKALWEARSWDYTGLLLYMRNQLDYMERGIREHGHCVGKDRHCDQMKVCVHLLQRLIEDEYGTENFDFIPDASALMGLRMEPKHSFPRNRKRLHKLEVERRKGDLEYLSKLMTKHLHSWWD